MSKTCTCAELAGGEDRLALLKEYLGDDWPRHGCPAHDPEQKNDKTKTKSETNEADKTETNADAGDGSDKQES